MADASTSSAPAAAEAAVTLAVKPDHLIWKPLRLQQLDWTHHERATVLSTAYEHIISTHWSEGAAPGLEACDTFLLSDLVVGESVLAGIRTSGDWSYGIVTGWAEGKYFTFDGPNEGSLLWNNLLLLRGAAVDRMRQSYQEEKHAREAYYAAGGEDSPPCPRPMKRTDSGANYGFSGRPDFKFWTRSGYKPWYLVGPEDYSYCYREDKGRAALFRLRADAMRKQLAAGRDDGSLTEEEVAAIRNQIEGLEAEAAESESRSRSASPKSPV